ncbi:hypothetical protein HPB47_016475 [Ixodes persulcatus]|uniref:Uncharacterized protein n=1 Tax=Ixodes persulcatus TaxID=34615 RepID=A0AC60QS15_IXOPE|nr:hypothetical protein HPB47_016475 [Ixodes persulcatus]
MSNGVYPTTEWTSDLARLPRISSPDLARLASCSGTEKGARPSYKLVTATSWRQRYAPTTTKKCKLHASDFRAVREVFRKPRTEQRDERWHIPSLAISLLPACPCENEAKRLDSSDARPSLGLRRRTGSSKSVAVATITKDGELVNGYCECPAGKQACSHLQAVLQTVILIQGKGFAEAPAHLSCTDLPQRWRRPRGQGVDWRRVGKGRQDLPRSCRLDLSKAKERTISQKKSAALQFASILQQLDGKTSLVAVLGAADRAQVCSSKCGDVLACSPLAYQQPLVPFGFRILLCEELEASGHLNFGRPHRRNAQDLEKNSRRQRDSATWLQARQYRLTASNFGTVHRHGEWTEKGLANLTSAKDLSRVPAVR